LPRSDERAARFCEVSDAERWAPPSHGDDHAREATRRRLPLTMPSRPASPDPGGLRTPVGAGQTPIATGGGSRHVTETRHRRSGGDWLRWQQPLEDVLVAPVLEALATGLGDVEPAAQEGKQRLRRSAERRVGALDSAWSY